MNGVCVAEDRHSPRRRWEDNIKMDRETRIGG